MLSLRFMENTRVHPCFHTSIERAAGPGDASEGNDGSAGVQGLGDFLPNAAFCSVGFIFSLFRMSQ